MLQDCIPQFAVLESWREGCTVKNAEKLFSYDRIFPRGQMQIPAAEIRQIAELSVMKGGEIKEHTQRCDELTYAISGRATVYSGDRVLTMSAGQIHWIRQGEYHRIVADPAENFHYCCIGFYPDAREQSIRPFLRAVEGREDFLVEDVGDLKSLFTRLINECFIPDEGSDLMIHYCLCQILLLLYRILNGRGGETLNRLNGTSSGQAVYRVLKYIDREYLHLTQVRQIAEALNYSEYHLCHVFREKMDMTVKEYLMRKKLTTAATLLESSSMTVSEIAEQLNFSSLHAFGQAFRRYMGASPSQYRQQSEEAE